MDLTDVPASRHTDSRCATCDGVLERQEEYELDIAGRGITFIADRCVVCGNQYVNAPEILRPDAEMLGAYRPEASPLGFTRRIVKLLGQDREFGPYPNPTVASILLAYLLREDLADVVLLAQQGVSEDPVVAYTKSDLLRAGQIRMGPSRAVFTGSGLRANLLTLAQLQRFAEADGGLHPRVAVMGRPCQVYTVRKLLWDRFVPGYELAFALGTFCYGNFSPGVWGAPRLRELLGFDPSEIREVSFSGEELVFTSVGRSPVRVGQADVAGLVNPNCLQCYDFTVSFSDVSVARVSPEDVFETAILRTELGERVVDQAIRDRLLAPSSRLYNPAEIAKETERAEGFLRAIVEIKRQIVRNIR